MVRTPSEDNEFGAAARDAKNAAEGNGTSNSGPGPSYNSDTRPVVMGYQNYNYSSGGYSGIPAADNKGKRPQVTTVYNGMNWLNDARANSPKQYNAAIDLMRQAGYLGPRSTSISGIETAWQTVLKDSAARLASNPNAKNVNVFDFLYGKAKSGSGSSSSSSSSGGGGYGGPFTNTTVQLTNEMDARALVDGALNAYLGRDASKKERANFWKQLNKAESANPSIQSGVTSKGGTSQVQAGGTNPQMIAEDFAMSRKDFAETQASTTVMDWIKESVTRDPTDGMVV